uniref:EF-hand domain-containing protein n=1 Tax=Lotharella oceanica TaxID=641309 RepID=A0A7S2XDH5_9EUKA
MDNTVLLHCGMSASSHAASTEENPDPGWWEQFIGPGRALDTDFFYIICVNNLGSCYGSSGPSSIDPKTGQPYGSTFPTFTIQDQVKCQFALLEHLGIDRIHASVGSSLGGMQALTAAALYGSRVKNVVSISACTSTHPGGIAFRQMQRECIMSDPNWNKGDYYSGDGPVNGLRLARQAGTITYRSGPEWQTRFGRTKVSNELVIGENFMIEQYIRHQGKKWATKRAFDPNSLIWMSTAMDNFTLEQIVPESGDLSLEYGMRDIMQPALVIGVQTDVLFPCWQQREIAKVLRKIGNQRVSYYELDSIFGHDTFLLDTVAVGGAVKGHLEQEPNGASHLHMDSARSASVLLGALWNKEFSADSMERLFHALAQNRGKVSIDEVSSLLYLVAMTMGEHCDKVTLEEILKYIKSLDGNNDGMLSKEEFMSLDLTFVCSRFCHEST